MTECTYCATQTDEHLTGCPARGEGKPSRSAPEKYPGPYFDPQEPGPEPEDIIDALRARVDKLESHLADIPNPEAIPGAVDAFRELLRWAEENDRRRAMRSSPTYNIEALVIDTARAALEALGVKS